MTCLVFVSDLGNEFVSLIDVNYDNILQYLDLYLGRSVLSLICVGKYSTDIAFSTSALGAIQQLMNDTVLKRSRAGHLECLPHILKLVVNDNK